MRVCVCLSHVRSAYFVSWTRTYLADATGPAPAGRGASRRLMGERKVVCFVYRVMKKVFVRQRCSIRLVVREN